MDDMKLYGRNPDQLKGLMHAVHTFSDDIQMKFSLDKCAVAHFVNGKISGHNSGVMVGKTDIKSTSIWAWKKVTVSSTGLCERHFVVSTFSE